MHLIKIYLQIGVFYNTQISLRFVWMWEETPQDQLRTQNQTLDGAKHHLIHTDSQLITAITDVTALLSKTAYDYGYNSINPGRL